jgi:rSAM/selenodomain-associated transferase 1
MRERPATLVSESIPVNVIVIAKAPVAGQVKTRLCPPLTPEQAAFVAEAALIDTLTMIGDARVRERTVVLDGDPGGWLPPRLRVIAQRSGAFPERLGGAIADSFAETPLPILLIGMDTPQIRTSQIEAAAYCLLQDDTDVVLGLAEDGGFWIIGTKLPISGMFEGVEMSTAYTGQQQLARLASLGLRCAMLPVQRDVDILVDALEVARRAPKTNFAVALWSCVPSSFGDLTSQGVSHG